MTQLKFIAVGDIFLGGEITNLIDEKGDEAPFKFVMDTFHQGDLLIGNLVSSISSLGTPTQGKYCIQSKPFTVNSLVTAGFDIMSLVNNHIFDYGFKSFRDTCVLLNQKKISWFGAGNSLNNARVPAIMEKKDLSIGFLGYSWNIINSVCAKRNSFGTAPLKRRLILKDVKKLEHIADIVVVVLHWGLANESYPMPFQRKLAHAIIDAGADLVLGSHPNVIQGIEEYDHGLIVYSLGNFIFPDIPSKDYNLTQLEKNNESIILKCTFTVEGMQKYTIHPVIANENFQPVLLSGEEKERVLDKLKVLSEGFQKKNYSRFWKENRINKFIPDLKYCEWLNRLIYNFSGTKLNRRLVKIKTKFLNKNA